MNTQKVFLSLMVLLGANMPGYGATVAPTPCVSASFNVYSQQGSCDIGIMSLSNFQLFSLDSNDTATAADTALLNTITVDPVFDSRLGILTVGVDGFTGLNNGANTGWLIRFTLDPPPVIEGEGVSLDPPHGSVTGVQSFCSNSIFNSDGFCTVGEAGGLGFGINEPGGVTFPTPLSVLDTSTSVKLGDSNSGFDGVVFSFAIAAPEPSTWAMLLGSCALAAGWSKRRRR